VTVHDLDFGGYTIRVHEEGSGSPVCFGHSLTFDASMFAAQSEVLAQSHRVLRFDLHGHGGSTAPDQPYTLEDVADDVARCLDRLEVQRTAWVGHSMGGMTGMRLALRHPSRVSRLALLNTSAQAEPDSIQQMYHQVNESSRGKPSNPATVAFVLQLMFSPDFAAAHPDRVAPYRRMLFEPPDSEGVYRTAHAVIWRQDLLAQISNLDLPVLVLTSAKDTSTPPHLGRAVAEAISGAVLIGLDGGHMSPVEQPEAVTSALVDFLGDP